MKLIGTPTSPYTRKVRIVLAEKHIEYDFIVDNPNTPDTHVSEHNPLGKIPVLILDDETTLFDSRVIVDYLDSASPVARLIPEDTRRRIQTRRWEALADGCADAAVAIVYERRRPTDKQFAETLTRQQGKVDRALKEMADELGDKAWCNGDHYSLADIAVGCALCFIELRLTDLIGWRKPYPNLVRLVDKLALRPTFRETEPPKA